jgi:hypothetical protein
MPRHGQPLLDFFEPIRLLADEAQTIDLDMPAAENATSVREP